MIKKITIIALIITILITAVSTWVLRDILFPSVPDVYPIVVLNIPNILKTDIERATKVEDNVVAVQVVTIHFYRNIRTETYTYINSPILQSMYDKFMSTKVVEIPVFNNNAENNKNMLKLINGEFVCVPFSESMAGKYVPSASDYVEYVCSIGIPPHHYGEFIGILSVYLKKIPNKEDHNMVFLFIRELSNKIYDANKVGNAYYK